MMEKQHSELPATGSLPRLLRGIDDALAAADDRQGERLGTGGIPGIRIGSAEESYYILLSIGTARLAVALEDLAEVGDVPAVTRLPNLPDWLTGITNIRGEIVSVVDLPLFLRWHVEKGARRTRMAVLRHQRTKVALLIDKVLGMHRKTEMSETAEGGPQLLGTEAGILPSGLLVDGQIHYVLDCPELFANKRFVEVRND